MAYGLERVANAIANKAYDILLEAEMQPKETREEYVEKYRAFYSALADVAMDEMVGH